MLTRRAFLAAASSAAILSARPAGLLIDTHIHLFARDRQAFPYHPNGPYNPEPRDLEDYRPFVAKSKIDHAVIVHPEPYQDDHSYLEHCFQHEPRPGFFKGTCLFDALDPKTPARMKALMARNPKRIVALRVHAVDERGAAPAVSGAIKNRDLASNEMKRTWKAAGDLGLAIQMHFRPYYSPAINKLAAEFPEISVVLDHLGRSGFGNAADFADILALADRPNTYMKFSGVGYSSKEDYPYDDARPTVKRMYEAFGPDRMIWGGLGYNMADFDKNAALLDRMFHFAPEADRAKIRGLTAKRLYAF